MGKSSSALDHESPPLGAYPRERLPSAADCKDRQIVVVDAGGSRSVVFSDGVEWKPVGSSTADATYTAAQLDALAAAGSLTPYATYVASDADSPTPQWARDVHTLVALPLASASARSVMLLGDSILSLSRTVPMPNQSTNIPYSIIYGTLPNIGGFVSQVSADPLCPAGAGTLRYWVADQSFSWQAFGDSEGPHVAATQVGWYTLPSGSADSALYIRCQENYRPASDKSDSVTVPALAVNYSAELAGIAGAALAALNFPCRDVYSYCVPGATATGILAARWQWGSVQSDMSIICLGTNQSSTLAASASALAAIQTIVSARLATGSTVLVIGLLPYNGASATVAGAKRWLQQELASMCAGLGIDFVDPTAYVGDPSSTAGAWAAGYSDDGTHPNVAGSIVIAQRGLVPALTKRMPAISRTRDVGVAYDAALAPRGNLAVNGALTGTAGTKGTRVTGTVPTGWSVVSSGANISCVCTAPDDASPVARTDGGTGNWFQLAVNNAAGVLNEYIDLSQSALIPAGNFALGDYVVLQADVELSASDAAAFSFWTRCEPNMLAYALATVNPAYNLGGGAFKATLTSNPMKLVRTPTGTNIYLRAYMRAGGTATVKVARISLCKVPEPVGA